MSLLPQVRRELLRVARAPLPDDARGAAPPELRSGRFGRWARGHHRPRLSGALVLAAALLAIAIGALFVSALHPGGSFTAAKRRALHSARGPFPGAPRSQAGSFDVSSNLCAPAPRNRYLPPHAGCVSVLRADVDGDGRPDLILVYSRVGVKPVGRSIPGLTAGWRDRHHAEQAFLKVVRRSGATVQTRIPAQSAAVVGVVRVAGDPGAELLLQTGEISSGSWAVAFGFDHGRLVPAGVTLDYGGDSATKAGFECLAGRRPGIVQRSFELLGSTISGSWKETVVSYAWHGPRLVRVAKRTFTRGGQPPARQTRVGSGCLGGIRSASRDRTSA